MGKHQKRPHHRDRASSIDDGWILLTSVFMLCHGVGRAIRLTLVSRVVNVRVVDECLLRRIVMPLPWPPEKRHGDVCLPQEC